MCGIFFSCSCQDDLSPSTEILDCVKRRGPDHEQVVRRKLEVYNGAETPLKRVFYLTFLSTVLSLRGDQVVCQPLEDPLSGSLLCWNGEAWKIDDTSFGGNDVQPIFSLLLEAIRHENVGAADKSTAYTKSLQAVNNVFARLAGPYAFVFYDARHQRIFYGRDILGRRSLVFNMSGDSNLIISSISDGSVSDAWCEVEANGIYMLDLAIGQTHSENKTHVLKHIPWEDDSRLFPHSVRSARASKQSLC